MALREWLSSTKSQETDLNSHLQEQLDAARKIDEARRERTGLERELQEFGQDAYFGSSKLRAINDALRVRNLEMEIYKAEKGLEDYPANKPRERQLAALVVRKGRIEDEMDDRKIVLPGYYTALTRLNEIISPLGHAYYTTAVFDNSRWSDSQYGVMARLDELVKEGIKRPAPNQQSSTPPQQ